MIDKEFIEACKELDGELWDDRPDTGISCDFDNGNIEFNPEGANDENIRAFFTEGKHIWRAGEHITAGMIFHPKNIEVVKEKKDSVYPGLYIDDGKENYLKVVVKDKKITEIMTIPTHDTLRAGGYIKTDTNDIGDVIFNIG